MRHLQTAWIATACVLLAACGHANGIASADDASRAEMNGRFYGDVSAVLFVDPSGVRNQYQEFIQKLRAIGPGSQNKRSLYEKYVPVIGANGVLAGITELWPTCHSEAHDLGKVIFADTKNIDTALRVCRDGCYSGCMHGVMMEAYAGVRDKNDPEGHVNVEAVKMMMSDMCNAKTMKESYSPGDCAHATGHALMVLAEYNIDEAIGWCDEFPEDHMRYYCATGAYMEYVTENDAADVAAKKPLLYPCTDHKYPAACARFKMVHVIPRLVRSEADVSKMALGCQHLKDPYRIGCFHGLGNGFMPPLVEKKLTLEQVCGPGNSDERAACIDGAMERMAKFDPAGARSVCAAMKDTRDRAVCDASEKRGMYDMQKDLSPYIPAGPKDGRL